MRVSGLQFKNYAYVNVSHCNFKAAGYIGAEFLNREESLMSIEAAAEAIKTTVASSEGIGATVKFACGDDGCVFIDGNQTPPSVSTDDAEADCTVVCELDVLNDLIAGDLDPTAAFMQGKIKVEGDMGVAMKLSSMF